MKRQLGIALVGSALAVAGAVGATGGTASAGCGATVEVHNTSNQTVTVHWHHSDSQADVNPLAGHVGGPWKDLFTSTNTSTIAPGAKASRAVVLDFGCNTPHRFRIEWLRGGSSGFATSNWISGSFAHIDVP